MDLRDHQELIRVANLANGVLVTLRQPARGRCESERAVASLISYDGVAYTAADLGPALGLLEAVRKLERPPVKQNVPRPGWLPTAPDQPGWSSPEPDVELETRSNKARCRRRHSRIRARAGPASGQSLCLLMGPRR
jgi:hypothetical protein